MRILFVLLLALPLVFNMKIALVTGSNKGIGRDIVQLLSSPPHSIKTILACRNRDLGEITAKELQTLGCDVVFHQLDLTDQESIRNTCDFISSEFGHLDVLINNAAVCFNDPTLYGKCAYTPFEKQAKISMETNFFGTLKVTQAMLPLLRKSESPRVINIASSAGRLAQLSKTPERAKLVSSPNLKLEHLISLMNEFVDDVEAGVHQQKGWPNTCYGMSKVGIIALSRMFAREEVRIMMNCVDPGYCATDQNNHQGYISSMQGAMTPVALAVLPIEQFVTGKYFHEGREIQW